MSRGVERDTLGRNDEQYEYFLTVSTAFIHNQSEEQIKALFEQLCRHHREHNIPNAELTLLYSFLFLNARTLPLQKRIFSKVLKSLAEKNVWVQRWLAKLFLDKVCGYLYLRFLCTKMPILGPVPKRKLLFTQNKLIRY